MDKPVYDLDTLEPIKVEAKQEEAPKEEAKKEEVDDKKEPEEEEDSKEEDAKAEPEAEKKSEDEGSKESKEESESEDAKEEEAKPIEINDFIKGRYEEKYEIKSQEELDATLDELDGMVKLTQELQDKNKELTEQLAARADAKPTFESEAQESIYKFVKDLNPANLSSGVQTWARLVGMDVAKEPAKLVLEEQFILDNPDLSREDAQRKFARDFNKKYAPPARENFETDAEFDEEKEMREIDMKADAAKARKFLLEKQKEHKTKETPKTEDTKTAEVPQVVSAAIKQMGTELETKFKDFSELIFSPTENTADEFKFGLSKDQKAQVYKAMKPWIENPASYDAKGKFVSGVSDDLMENVMAAAFTLFGPELIAEAYKAGQNKGEVKKADKLAQRQPDRKAKAAGETPLGKMTEDQQWEMLAKKKKAQQNQGAR